MIVKEINNLDEIQKYYDYKTNTYVFKEDNEYIDLVVFNFDLHINANINAFNIKAYDINVCDINASDINAFTIYAFDIIAHNINAYNINARDIKACSIESCDINADDICACNINANDINYFAVCFAYENIKCKSIKGRRENAEHFVLDGKLEVKNNE